MKKMLVIVGMVLSLNVFAECEVSYTRTACKGMESESFSKCDGKSSCTKVELAEDDVECKSNARKACSNARTQVTKSKVVTAKWNGKELLSKTGKSDFCESYDKKDLEFNKCK
jgi:hypothetical protein